MDFKILIPQPDLSDTEQNAPGKESYLVGINPKTDDRIMEVSLEAYAFGDSIFEFPDAKEKSLMPVYSIWVEINSLYSVIEKVKDLYGQDHIDFTIKDELLKCQDIYDCLSNTLGKTILKKCKYIETDYNLPLLEELVDKLRGKVVVDADTLKSACSSYEFGEILETTVPKLLYLCNDDGIEWYTKIIFKSIDSAPNLNNILDEFLSTSSKKQK
ncbi:hypothetical protein GQ472_00205 [archaeon]|nr:hypothetical protein [archaeon]